MATEVQTGRPARATQAAVDSITVEQFTDGVLDPARPMLGPIRSGGRIVAHSAPGCWGPMITPELRGGHEVTRPVAVEGAEVGDALVLHIERIVVTSRATASGCDRPIAGRFLGDPFVAAKCPQCGTMNPPTVRQGIGPEAIRCAACGADATPFHISHGYTIAFDESHRMGTTVDRNAADRIAQEAVEWAALPPASIQNPILTFAPHDLVGVSARLRPFLGQLGTTPGVALPDSHNAGDFGSFLIGAPHALAVTAEQLQQRTDGHMDIDAVREGAIVVCPVKVRGGGVYLGDMHAMQGDGEIAGHTCDVAGTTTLRVELVKGLAIDGPVLFPRVDDLPPLAKPFTAEERAQSLAVARAHGLDAIEETLPISVVGTGVDLNIATENGLRRAAALLEMPVEEVRNRATIAGAIEIGRHPGVVQVTFHCPVQKLERCGLLELAHAQYAAQH
jgi:formamidase